MSDSTSERPSFVALYKTYIDAFNRHSWEEVQAILSPDIEVYVRGKLSNKGWEATKPHYLEHWAMPNGRASIESIEELKNGENGVQTKVVDHARDKLLHVRYVYAKEGEGKDGKWVQIQHHIDEVEDWTGKLKADGDQANDPGEDTS